MVSTTSIYLVFGLFFTVSAEQVCVSDLNCPKDMRCWATMEGYSICTKIGDGVQPDYPTPPPFYCNTDHDCAPSQTCVHPQPGGSGSCQYSSAISCTSNNDCAPGQTCVLLQNLHSVCQITIGGYVPGTDRPIQVGGVGIQCKRDSDCRDNQRCVDYHGRWQCMYFSAVTECRTTSDCPNGKLCAYSTYVARNVCVDPVPQPMPIIGGNAGIRRSSGESFGNAVDNYSGDFRQLDQDNVMHSGTVNPVTLSNVAMYTPASAPVTGTPEIPPTSNTTMKTMYTVMREAQLVPKHAVIDPAALPCEFDYQCRMGESCSGVIALVDRNITVCQYDVTKVDRLCIFHADCLQGQQCRRNSSGMFICTPSIEAALGTVPCVYDYECSGGEKCLNIAGPGKEKRFRCRQSKTNDPRHDQLCNTNAECPYQQVCRRIAGVSLCVDVVASTDPTAMLDIQRKVVKLVQDLLFSRL